MALQAFGKRLAQLRREKAAVDQRDLDRRDVAKAIGVSPSSITRWEGGEVWPGEDAMADLAKFYGVSRSWLRYGEGERSPAPTTAVEVVAGPKPHPSRAAASPTKRRTGGR